MSSHIPESGSRWLAGTMIALVCASCFVAPARAQGPKILHVGDVLSGGLTMMRGNKKKNRPTTFQLTSEPRRLPPPNGMCNLETGPETFQIVTGSDAEVSALKPFVGKDVSIKAVETSCAHDAGQWSDAIVTKWSVVK